MTTKDEALKLALEALEEPKEHIAKHRRLEAITAIKEVLAQPEPPPECQTEVEKKAFAFGWWKAMEAQRLVQPEQESTLHPAMDMPHDQKIAFAYGHNPRAWVGLTDGEIMEMLGYSTYGRVPQYARNFVDAIEAKLKEKNHD